MIHSVYGAGLLACRSTGFTVLPSHLGQWTEVVKHSRLTVAGAAPDSTRGLPDSLFTSDVAT